jgi:hypothetical protein
LPALLDAAIVAVAGVEFLFPIFMLAAGAMCIYGARSLAANLGAPASARFGISLFALYNPWVYTEFVAGHLGMIVAYGATMAFIGESLRSKPRSLYLALFVCVSTLQFQFFLVLGAFAAYMAVTKRLATPLLTGVIFGMPTVVGILGNRATVAAIPYNLTWQTLQSLKPIDAAALTGYFADYVSGFSPYAFDAVWSMAALSIIGLFASRRKALALSFALLGTVAWIWSTGVEGPIGAVYAAAILRVPALEIFRELYDLLAYVAIAYVALASIASGSNWFLALSSLVPGVVLAVTWCVLPPTRWLVPLRALPAARVNAPPNTRVAFMPDIQPLKFQGRGSGLDPDAHVRPHNVETLNGPESSYPATVALRRFALRGDPEALEALGVSRVISRPWLETDIHNALGGLATQADLNWHGSAGTTILAPLPELSLYSELRVSAIPPPIGSAWIFFGDAAGLSGPSVPASWKYFERPAVLPATRDLLLAKDGWVDVRLAYDAEPEIGQGLGGLLTTSRVAYLNLKAGRSALIWVRGRLIDASERLVSGSTNGYRWIPIERRAARVRCAGECVVVAQGNPPVGLSAATNALPYVPVPFAAPAPWLAFAVLAPDSSPMLLRYAVGYDPNWLALTAKGKFAHVRLETALNGWVVPPHAEPERILLIQTVAALQTFLEIVAVGWMVWLLYGLFRRNEVAVSPMNFRRAARSPKATASQ